MKIRKAKRYIYTGLMLSCIGFLISGCSSKKTEKKSGDDTVAVKVEYSDEYREKAAQGMFFDIDEKKGSASVIGYYDLDQKVFRVPDEIIYEDKTYPVVSIGDGAFGSNGGIEELILGKNVKEMEDNACYTCPELKKITFSDNLQKIGSYALGACGFQEIELPDSLKSLGSDAFSFSEELKKVTIPAGIKKWGTESFAECRALEEIIFLDGVISVGEGAFTNDEAVKTVKFPDSLQTIGPEAFWGCSSIKELDLPEGLTSIGDRAFMYTAVQELKVPEGISEITYEKFEGMDELKKLIVPEVFKEEYKELYGDYVKVETY